MLRTRYSPPYIRFVQSVLLLSVLGWFSPVYAQLEEVIVTAQKRSESLQDVAVAVTAITGESLRNNLITEPRDLFQRVPNVSVQSNATNAQLQLSIRGISFATFSPLGVQPILIFQDEVVLNSPAVGGMWIYDLQQVEVLRGPQNTLYGRNTTAGAVNFISVKPEIGGEPSGYFDLTYGSFNQINFDGAVGIPISDNAAMRVSVQSLNNDGMFENVYTGEDAGGNNQLAGRIQLAVNLSDNVDMLLNVHGGSIDGDGRPIKAHGLVGPDGNPCPRSLVDTDNLNTACVMPTLGIFEPEREGTPTYSDNGVVNNDTNGFDKIDAWGAFANINWTMENASLRSITAYETNDYDHYEDADGTPIPFVTFRQKSSTNQFSQEFRLSSNDDQPLRWIAGLFGFWESADLQTAVPILGFFTDSGRVHQDNDMWAVYGQLSYDFTPKLTGTVGLRYVSERKKGFAEAQSIFDLSAFDVNTQGDILLFDNLTPYRDVYNSGSFDETWTDLPGNIALEYMQSDDLFFYGKISRGVKAGMFPDAPDAILGGGFFTPAEPESVWSYEVGIKAQWLNNTLQTNVAVFYNDYTNQQLQITVPTEGDAVTSTMVNAAKSETSGAEIEVEYAPGGGWYTNLSLGFLHTEVTKDSLGELTNGDIEIQVGRELTNAPKFTGYFAVRKEWELANANMFSAGVDVRYTGERNFDLIDTPERRYLTTDPSYWLLNAVMTYSFGEGGRYRLSAWGKNLLDETYFQHMQEFGIESIILFTSNPRQIGVEFGMNF